ncbi:bifunctional helix-turn-helix transcriptional regulator/GNAT family N-acetyltransferase [Micromonospora endophytica]|uniref:MarR family transcriptional regulator n=1 Tax=Micromonospora endophytica TaxID=515350 RepID=A0A2W2C093_9ACTN|nr:bifunctional helix-turn-helix transcriptional regulator/GNAT family N-acetyltransferase [Micromonospora endophytica]PZF91812.1 MarR family transcriptional regulator [Micromonospora endophytica]RIW44389.1 GNAT family N-acetyltransferase [Micromonospora endophytica]BCJ62409.1 putative transcriptional regulator, MarR family protein [Micromonospora endophytica]
MDRQRVDVVRHFSRTVTQRVGALDDSFLARDRPLAQSRLLWEIGLAGAEVAVLRTRLDLDAGYLSRLLRALEGAGLVTVGSADGDGRVRTARLTEAGRAEWHLLDRRSDELAWSMLAPLSDGQRDRLIAAMSEVQRLLMASLVTIDTCPPGDARARTCLRAYLGELNERFETGFDLDIDDEPDLVPPAGLFLVATLNTEAVGCGALRFSAGEPAEIKRLWVSRSVRGLGVGRRLLGELERRAAAAGADTVRLDTNGSLTEAIQLYRSAGYHEIPRYNTNPYAHHWFAKRVAGLS